MGVVYKAKQINLDRIVAIKLLPFGQYSSENVVQRFRVEAAAAGALFLSCPDMVSLDDRD
jgi:serine/threonine protein kinase